MPLNQGQRNTIWQEFINESKKTREEVLRNGVVYEASDVFKYLKASINGELKQGQKTSMTSLKTPNLVIPSFQRLINEGN